MKKTTVILLISTVFTISVRAQGFLNLNFESASNLPGDPPVPEGTPVAVTNALPDWAVYDGTLALSDVYYISNTFTGFSTAVELEGGSLALSGDYSVGLFSGGSISQTGLVPTNAESLQFEASSSSLNLALFLGGQTLSYSAISDGPNYTVYGANIPSALAGQTETLTLAINGGQSALDNIEFSTMSVPEPGEWAMIGFGTILVGVRSVRRRKFTTEARRTQRP